MSANWLAQLAPGRAPAAPGWWPFAAGWWGVLVLILLLGAAVLWWRRDPHRWQRHVALREIRLISTTPADEAQMARAVQGLLRRFAVAVFGVGTVGRLSGEQWLRFMGAEGATSLAGEAGRSLLAAAFGNRASGESQQWLVGAESFVRRAARRRAP